MLQTVTESLEAMAKGIGQYMEDLLLNHSGMYQWNKPGSIWPSATPAAMQSATQSVRYRSKVDIQASALCAAGTGTVPWVEGRPEILDEVPPSACGCARARKRTEPIGSFAVNGTTAYRRAARRGPRQFARVRTPLDARAVDVVFPLRRGWH